MKMTSLPRGLYAWLRKAKGESVALPKMDPSARLYDTSRIVLQRHSSDAISIGANTHVRGELLLFGHGGRIKIGNDCYVGEHTRIWSGCEIVIGDRVLIAHHVTIMDNLTHPLDAEERHRHFKAIVNSGHPTDIDLNDSPVRIEDDAWIGCNCVINRGTTIGRAAIVAAGSVVTKSVPKFAVVAGNPAQTIKLLTPTDRP